MTVMNETFSIAPTLRARFASLRATLVDAAAKRNVYRTTVRELENLSARELADLGLTPFMIREVAHQAAYGK